MRKILSILGAVSVSTIGVINAVSCTPRRYIPKEEEEIPEVKEFAKFDSFIDFLKMQMEKSDVVRFNTYNFWSNDGTEKSFLERLELMRDGVKNSINTSHWSLWRNYNSSGKVNNDVFMDKDGDETYTYLNKTLGKEMEEIFIDYYGIIYPQIRVQSGENGADWTIVPDNYTKSKALVIDQNYDTFRTYQRSGYVEIKVLESSIFWNLKPNENGYESFYVSEYGLVNDDGFRIWFDTNDIPPRKND
ncbi:hypothetical protein SCLARK_001469 [Spiroplasma clarkii]|uniref:Lipoprotein n=1 Tax=Spiroplasma clarkii TaxID=2139 RepID=A0A1Y0L1X0_9MOLU|nr:lipoprotein [Spiroplasma clarkii]ARU91986.1 hypothetical protein SCLARK_001469 [Spiroplasma clarkii]ATX71324.1 hypothetical protein SCLAR_v1c10240 [Spiroplasma clarkii]